jgi:predicted amidohydrolase
VRESRAVRARGAQGVAARAVWIADVAVLDVAKGERTPARDVLVAERADRRDHARGRERAAGGCDRALGKGATLVPGLVDMHGHIYADTHPIWARGLPDPRRTCARISTAGVTTVFDPGDNSSDAFARARRVARGELVGPHIFTAGRSTPRPRATRLR